MRITVSLPRQQSFIAKAPYDCWLAPDGSALAEFYRRPSGFLVRFPSRADFEIEKADYSVVAWPSPDVPREEIESIYRNSICPIIGNYRGGLFLHGSAICIDDGAVAFLGQSRSGKTTLACAMAKKGFSLLTEDVIELTPTRGELLVEPKPSAVRLFADSAAFILGEARIGDHGTSKQVIEPSDRMPFASHSVPLRAVFFLGTAINVSPHIHPLDQKSALASIMQHSFVLDVEDQAHLRGHFDRLADLVLTVPCFELEYERSYAKLPTVISAVLKHCREIELNDCTA